MLLPALLFFNLAWEKSSEVGANSQTVADKRKKVVGQQGERKKKVPARQRVGGASEIEVNTCGLQETIAGGGKHY